MPIDPFGSMIQDIKTIQTIKSIQGAQNVHFVQGSQGLKGEHGEHGESAEPCGMCTAAAEIAGKPFPSIITIYWQYALPSIELVRLITCR